MLSLPPKHLRVAGPLLPRFLLMQANVRVTTADGPQILLNISSAAAHMVVGIPVLAAYGSSKAAAASFLQTLAAQFEEKKLRIINIHPGSVMTEGVKDTAAIDQDRARDDRKFSTATTNSRPVILMLHCS